MIEHIAYAAVALAAIGCSYDIMRRWLAVAPTDKKSVQDSVAASVNLAKQTAVSFQDAEKRMLALEQQLARTNERITNMAARSAIANRQGPGKL